MKRFLLVTSIFVSIFFLSNRAFAQGNQTVVNGNQTTAVNFPSGGCGYKWVNNTPGIGLAASGSGDIPAFTAVNTGSMPITATISVTPIASSFAYVANYGSNNVSVINAVDKNVITTIPVGTGPYGVSANTSGTLVYVTNTTDNNISVINTTSNTVTATIPVGLKPEGVVVSPDSKRVYVANSGSNAVSVIDATTNVILTTIPVDAGPLGIAESPDGSLVYVTNVTAGTMSVISTSTNSVITTISLGWLPEGIAVSPDGSKIYLAISGYNQILVLNAGDYSILKRVQMVDHPFAIAISPDGSKAYVSGSGYFTTIFLSDYETMTFAAMASAGVSVTPDGSSVFSLDYGVMGIDVLPYYTYSKITVGNNPVSLGNFIAKGPGCNGSPFTYTITIKPSSVTPVITAGAATGTIAACQGSPSADPDIQQFTVSGAGLTNNITATAPAGFEVSLSAGSGYGGTVTIPQSGGTANNTTVYVRSAASATGNISGNVTLTSQGANAQNVAVTGKINPLPTVNSVSNQTVVAGNNTTAINFTGTGNIFNWTNDTPGIGLAANGTGNIPAFTAINTGNAPVIAKVTVTNTNKQAGYEYMTNETTNQVSVISNSTNQIVSTVDVGAGPYGIALSPDGSMAYVSNFIASSVSVINTSTNQVAATIPVGYNPVGIAISPNGSKVYVCAGFGLFVIDATTNQIITALTLANYEPSGITVSPNGKWLYVADPVNNSLLIINASTYQQTRVSIPTNIGDSAINVAVSPDGNLIYVTGGATNNVYMISAITQTIVNTINLNAAAIGIAISPDGSRIYVTNEFSNMVSVVNATNGALITTITVGTSPEGISVSPDGSTVYVANVGSNNMSIINAADNQVTATVAAGATPHSLGNFVRSSISCSGPPMTFTITINPTPPSITTTPITGTISACQGSPAVNPDIQQFTVSGNSLTNDIIATAPSGFEVSLSASGAYSNSVTLAQSGGKVNNVTVYVRSAASATGNISGNITLTSQSATAQNVAVSGIINSLPTVNTVSNQTIKSGSATKVVKFTGTANTYNWVNDNPAVGATSGTGDISSFTPINTGNTPITGTFTVTPLNTAGCSGTPITFTIEVDPILPAVITATGTLSPLSTTYGTASTSTNFSVSGTNMNAGILITPPAGFEVSTDNINFSSTVTVGTSGTINATTVYVRLTSQTPVGSYSGDIVLSSSGATSSGVAIPISTVNPAVLTITANNVQKVYGQTLTKGAVSTGFTANGLQNNETIGSVFITYDTGAGPSDKAGTYTGSVVPSNAFGGSFNPKNYTITYQPGDIIVIEGLPSQPIAIPNAFTPNGDGINDVWNIKSLIDYPSCLVSIFTRYGSMIYQSRGYARPWDGFYNGSQLPAGTYYYIINLQNGQPPFSGWVALIR